MSADTSTFSAIIDTNLQHGEISTWRESSEGEHADLLRDVLPAARGSQLFEAFLQSIPHGNDSGTHSESEKHWQLNFGVKSC